MKSRESPSCSVIIPNWNGKKFLQDCLLSLQNQTYEDFEVILVDNASRDNSVEFVRNNFPWIKIVQNKNNLGFVGGCNVGAKYAKGDYLIFLNNDTKTDDRWLEELVKTAALNASIGICGSKILDYDGKRIDDAGFSIDIFGFPYKQILKVGASADIMDVFVASGGAFLIKKRIWQIVDGFDPRYYLYTEIIDLCWRVQLLGYEVLTVPRAIVYHRCAGTTSKITYANRRYFSERNTLRMLVKNFDIFTLVKIMPKYFALILAEFFVALLVREVQLALAYIQTILWNVRNFKDTWHLHKKIQRIRIVDDNAMLIKMFSKSAKLVLFKPQFLRQLIKKQ